MTLADLARRSSELDARISITTLEYPADHLQLQSRNWPLQPLVSALAVGLVSVAALLMVQRVWPARRRAV